MDNNKEITLSEEQINDLFAFTRQKYVRYIDVQYEIVDHLASAIEEEMSADTKMTFKQALNRVYGRFPITGFSNLVASKEKALTKYWYRKLGKFFVSYLTPPRILVTAAIFILCFTMIKFFGKPAFITILVSMTVISLYGAWKYNRRILRSLKIDQYLFASCYNSIMIGPLSLPFYISIFLDDFIFYGPLNVDFTLTQNIIASIFIAATAIFLIGSFTEFPQMIRDEIERKYKHLGLKLA